MMPGSHAIPFISSKELVLADHIYKKIELTGSSTTSMEDAIQKAIARAAKSIENLRWFEVVETRGHIEDGKVAHWQVTVKIGFTVEDTIGDDEP
jgi:flavin-binding protein dodecin